MFSSEQRGCIFAHFPASRFALPPPLPGPLPYIPSSPSPLRPQRVQSASDSCEVRILIRTEAVCFHFGWSAGDWGDCEAAGAAVGDGDGEWQMRRRVSCVERHARATNVDDAVCDKAGRPNSSVACAAPPSHSQHRHDEKDGSLSGWPLALLVCGVVLIAVAAGAAASAIVTQHRAAVQRRRLLALTASYQGLPVPLRACGVVQTYAHACAHAHTAHADLRARAHVGECVHM
eukprot:6177865-Pleurochrysis_carterae.AAC.1